MRKSALLAAMMAGALSMGAASPSSVRSDAPLPGVPKSPRGHGSHRSNKPTLDREKRDRRNRIAKLSRRRNRGR